MITVFKGVGDSLYGDPDQNIVINSFGLTNLIFNLLALVVWLCSKFNLFYLTECQKMLKKKKNDLMNKNDNNEEEIEEITLTVIEKIKAGYIV